MSAPRLPTLPVVAAVVAQHADEAVSLAELRRIQVAAPHVELHRLRRLDDRIAAHLDGLMVAGDEGMALLQTLLAPPGHGVVFALTVCALQHRRADLFARMLELAQALPDAESGLEAALAWVAAEDLQGTVRALLDSPLPRHRAWGLGACAAHGVDPGPALRQAIEDADAQVQACAWRVASRFGRADLLERARAATSAGLAGSDLEAARAAAAFLTRHGEGGSEAVRLALLAPGAGESLAPEWSHRLALLAAPLEWGREQVRAIASRAESSPPHLRRMIRMAGWVGDPQVLPWLITQMGHEPVARLAGESFSLITGADLAALDLERRVAGADAGPGDTPEDDDVALDEDDGLPWPETALVQGWWGSQAGRFTAGRRHFAGQAPQVDHLVHVLRTAGQRQRRMAADHLCLLHPGTACFPVEAPAWRQSRWLAGMQPNGG